MVFSSVSLIALASLRLGDVVNVSETQNLDVVELRPGVMLKVKLPSNPSTGYSWGIVSAPKGLNEISEPEYVSDPAPEGMTGSGGNTTFTFHSESAAKGELKLAYKRQWENDEKPEKEFTLFLNATVVKALSEKRVSVKVGDVLEVPVKHTTGTAYFPVIPKLPSFLTSIRPADSNEADMPGAPMVTRFRFLVTKPGTAKFDVRFMKQGDTTGKLLRQVSVRSRA